MKIDTRRVNEESSRDLFWTSISISSDDGLRNTRILASASQEFFEKSYELSGGKTLTEDVLNKWRDSVVSKWSRLGDELFRQDVHYDSYANTEDGEAKGVQFLMTKI